MVDKRSSKQPDAIPKKPPKRLSRDYTNLPQRPITLKPLKKKKPLPTPKKASVKSKPAVKQTKKVAAKKSPPRVKRQPADQWLLKGVSEETKQYALEEANRRGVSVGQWIEQLIIDYRQPTDLATETTAETDIPQPREEINEAIHAIEERLDRIEERRGFWSRFWDQVMKQAEKQQQER
ncbi:MAG: hypothetical protein KME56_04290 [Candidatus Thiodiazotropha sp. (ex Ctena orbiculata)]|uniref:Uncharacterized protein n=1 Tax=Candidatus Thiodiazotropha taylori TaxID=2792791 RepID=A0A944M620_9GAMM|nr:hypothetical protein [Candidatus Thiodiazotropha taylori]MBT2987778.1 hypothetical protein [Candidatus Thiodiazotropha taylori]MBT2995835.1 hypothetical protein [Candidatus Thiodiazotropha taylori]MBT2999150.1 hypothetical protein [Candidatus Thiodiazotropha taylori]MBT3026082.1 hypothetical protein [Candidatus Thiodiazotropha taylori]